MELLFHKKITERGSLGQVSWKALGGKAWVCEAGHMTRLGCSTFYGSPEFSGKTPTFSPSSPPSIILPPSLIFPQILIFERNT